jgi:hypothetical protein
MKLVIGAFLILALRDEAVDVSLYPKKAQVQQVKLIQFNLV